MRQFLAIFCLFAPGFLWSQAALLPLERSQIWNSQRTAALNDQPSSSIWPMSQWSWRELTDEPDSASASGVMGEFGFVRVRPRMDVQPFTSTGPSTRSGIYALGGVALEGRIKKRWAFEATYDLGHAEFPQYLETITDSLQVVPGFGRAYANGKGNRFSQTGLVVGFKPSEHFELFAGRGRHFIGDGYRSLFLSDFAGNYNFLRLDVDVWKLNYSVIYTQGNQVNTYRQRFAPTVPKYATIHYLSIDATPWWTIGAFEAVVWEQEDSLINRGFDVNYLNPVIFLRPVEFGIGSSDNSLVGLSSTIRPSSSLHLYGQLLIDEFVFSEVTAGLQNRLSDTTLPTGWWANKQAFQLGVKSFDPFGWKNSTVLAEFNLVRPFTYGHSAPGQSYTHLNQALAHPLGANFIEWLASFDWQPGKWNLNLTSTYARKGFSENSAYLGEDIMRSNTLRDQNNREWGNRMLQGQLVDVANTRFTAGYTLMENWSLRIETSVQHRFIRSDDFSDHSAVFMLGLRTALWNTERNL